MRMAEIFREYGYLVHEDADTEAKHADHALQSAKKLKTMAGIKKSHEKLANQQKRLADINRDASKLI